MIAFQVKGFPCITNEKAMDLFRILYSVSYQLSGYGTHNNEYRHDKKELGSMLTSLLKPHDGEVLEVDDCYEAQLHGVAFVVCIWNTRCEIGDFQECLVKQLTRSELDHIEASLKASEEIIEAYQDKEVSEGFLDRLREDRQKLLKSLQELKT